MKRVLIRAFIEGNLGDDLFVKILCQRYLNVKFYLLGHKKYAQFFSDIPNLKYINDEALGFKIMNNLYMRLPKNKNKENNRNVFLYNHLSRLFDENICVTGSYFIESKEYWGGVIDKMWYESKPYLLGCNFGPYVTDKYYKEYKQVFSNAKQISFREKYSYELFKDLENVEYHPDIIFSLKHAERVENDMYIISVVDRKKDAKTDGNNGNTDYILKMREIAKKLGSKGSQIVFLSFCDEQGDLEIINEIIKEDMEKINYRVESYQDLKIEKTLSLLSSCKGIVATRFHAMILGLLFQKEVMPIIYSSKMENVLDDLNYSGKKCYINKMMDISCDMLEDYFLKYDGEVINIVQKEAEKHFSKLDIVLQ